MRLWASRRTSTNPASRQYSQVLGDARLAHSQGTDELPDRSLGFAEEVEDLPAVGLGKDFERLTHDAEYYCIAI